MKPIAALLVLGLAGALAAPASAAPAPASAAQKRPPTRILYAAPDVYIDKHVLPNGLTVALLPIKNSPVTTMHTWVRAGSRNEKPGITGIAHLFEHMMFRPVREGAKSYYDQAAELGLDYNASTRFNATDYYNTFTPELLPRVVAMEAERFKNLTVTPELLKVEREAVRSEYSTKFDANPMIDLWFWIYRLAYPDHPYGWHIIGERDDLDRITADDANRFFKQNYVPNNALIAVAGTFDKTRALALIEKHFGDWKRGSERGPWVPEPEEIHFAPIEGKGKLESPSKYMLMGWRVPDGNHPHRLDQYLTEYILFNGKDALVPKRLLDQQDVAGMADAFNTGYDIGLAKIIVLPKPGVTPARIHQEVQAAIDSFNKLPDADFQAYARAYATQMRESQLNTHGITAALGHAWAYDYNIEYAVTDPQRVLSLPREAVAKVIRTTYRPGNRVTVVTP